TPAGATEQFLGDPNVTHTFTGSPFLTNYLRVDGPEGSNISGIGDDFVQTPLANILGQLYLAPIATPLRITRSSYARDAASGGVTSIDVFATSRPGVQLLVTGVDMKTTQMTGDAAGNYVAHVEIPAGVIPPASITVTNVTDVPASSISAAVSDLVDVTSASFDTLTSVLKVTAASSDQIAPPALSVLGPSGGALIAGTFIAPLPAGAVYPQSVTVSSTAGGQHTEDVLVLPNFLQIGILNPVALADAVSTNMNVAVSFSPAANDAVALPVGAAFVVVPAANGTATSGAGGVITYKPALNFSGTDTFQVVVQDASGHFTNASTVTVTVNFVAVAPTANADSFALIQNKALAPSSRTFSVIANDFAATGTTINAGSVVITTLPLHGNVVVNGDGTVTYTPVVGYVGADSYRYTVANTAGAVSAAATVSIVVEGGIEALSMAKQSWKASTGTWTLVGTTNWFGPTLTTTTVTCYVGRGTLGAKIGTALVDTAGRFQLVTATAPAPDATNVATCQTSNGGTLSFAVQRI
ncbi:MAG: Ig-like domain-containing protein, partial [Anaeromyxobacteraceae bacterium]